MKRYILTELDYTRELLNRFPCVVEEIKELQNELIVLKDNRTFIQSSVLKQAVVQCEQINKLENEVIRVEERVENILSKINNLYDFRRSVWKIYFAMTPIKREIVKYKYFERDVRSRNKDIARKLNRSELTIKDINTTILKEFRSINKYKYILN